MAKKTEKPAKAKLKRTVLTNTTPTQEERKIAGASDAATRSNKKASKILKQHQIEGGEDSGTSLSARLEIERDLGGGPALGTPESEDAAIKKFMAEPSASAKSTAKNRRAVKFIGLKPGDPQLVSQGLPKDPEAGHAIAATKLGGPAPEFEKGKPKNTYHKGPRSDSPAGVQARALSEGTADEYWKSALETGGEGAFTELGATRGDKPVGGFCTNCDAPITRDVEAAVPTAKKGPGGITKFVQGTLLTPNDDTLCDTCGPHGGAVTAEGQSALAQKFNVQRGERG